MRSKHYKSRTIRLDDKIWEELKTSQKKSGDSWNLFIKKLIEKYENNIY